MERYTTGYAMDSDIRYKTRAVGEPARGPVAVMVDLGRLHMYVYP